MKRLTKKFEKYGRPYCFNCKESIEYSINGDFIVNRTLDKLGQLEDIEEELGIDLIIIFKALKDGCYALYAVDKEPAFIEPGQVHIMKDRLRVGFWPKEWANDKLMSGHECVWGCPYKDYGKTWALTRQELE